MLGVDGLVHVALLVAELEGDEHLAEYVHDDVEVADLLLVVELVQAPAGDVLEDDVEVVGLREILDDLHDVGVVQLLEDLHLLVGLEEVHVLVDVEDLAHPLDAAVALQHLPHDRPPPPQHLREVVQLVRLPPLAVYYLLHSDLHVLLSSHALQPVHRQLSIQTRWLAPHTLRIN